MRDLSHIFGHTRSLTHWARLGIEPVSSWIQVRFLTRWATMGTPRMSILRLLNAVTNRYTWDQVCCVVHIFISLPIIAVFAWYVNYWGGMLKSSINMWICPFLCSSDIFFLPYIFLNLCNWGHIYVKLLCIPGELSIFCSDALYINNPFAFKSIWSAIDTALPVFSTDVFWYIFFINFALNSCMLSFRCVPCK